MERVIDCPCCKDSDSCFEEVRKILWKLTTFLKFPGFICGIFANNDKRETNKRLKRTIS